MAWSTPKTTFATGDVVTATELNNIGTDLNLTAPGVVTTKGDVVAATGSHAIAPVGVGGDWKPLIGMASQSAGVRFAAYEGVFLLDRSISDTNVNNDNTEQSLYSFTVPANTMGSAKGVRVRVYGTWRNHKGSTGIFTLKFKFGGTAGVTLSMSVTDSAAAESACPFVMEWLVYNTGTSAQTVMAKADFFRSNALEVMNQSFSTQAKDTTGDLVLELTEQMDAADTTFRITKKIVTAELI